ncbi:hypothetical protein G6F70_008494 [Rhizopus microsporus]|uniref:Uncharacterized protein n=1 Tax=Rhizopus azygosporus TaxID=86630 RepID=A0A367JBC1_RHIAZ|nr:hypothetical protein G6F71_007655 [Rhizopus microsporus]RCH87206.1 hypothetical protein CU097_005328 [Rhizopus azygosporus]KAG1195095.1 hypothetical protein G6F70_008494 [Rhizopus microsporus]KAG1207421.1 hypothetical protein G6F69_008061 [Rhizopus microsporus]KAG1227570.1 hypothetical protein G6F67_008373 [Rhizopus microsporus]
MPPSRSSSEPTLNTLAEMIQKLQDSCMYGFIDTRRDFASEIKDLKDRISLLTQENAALKAELTELRKVIGTTSTITPAVQNTATTTDTTTTIATTKTGLFADNLFPERNIPIPKVSDTRSDRKERSIQFNWKHYRWLINQVRGPDVEEIDDRTFEVCRMNVSSKIVKAAVDSTKRTFNLGDDLSWGSIPGDAQIAAIEKLEDMAAPFIPLRACAGYWGANILLSYYWTTRRRTEKKKATISNQENATTSNTSSQSDEPHPVVSDPSPSVDAEENETVDLDADQLPAVSITPKRTLGKKVSSKRSSKFSSKRRRVAESEANEEER